MMPNFFVIEHPWTTVFDYLIGCMIMEIYPFLICDKLNETYSYGITTPKRGASLSARFDVF